MKISIITVFPHFYDAFTGLSLVARAIENGIVKFNIVPFSDLVDAGKRIDESICGPGPGMIIKPAVVQSAIELCENKWGKGFKIFFSARGQKLDQRFLNRFVIKLNNNISDVDAPTLHEVRDCDIVRNVGVGGISHIILICARYEGIDDRVEDYYADLILSIGDYVLMGGDLPAQVFLEGLLRLIPGIVGRKESVERESFQGPFLDYPQFGLPKKWKCKDIPGIILSGDHAKIEKWREDESCKKTLLERFDWLRSSNLTNDEILLCKRFIPNHYVALMHRDVIVNGVPGNTSITSLDIHDIARTSKTFGIKNYFIVTGIKDQQKLLKEFLDFWLSKHGKEYNFSRYQAICNVLSSESLDDVIEKIKLKEGKEPIIISTSAKSYKNKQAIDFYSQGVIWNQKRPVLFLLGTGQGLTDYILDRSDYLLLPIVGFSEYNHLSVRSAAAIIFDRFLGINIKQL